MLQLITLLLLLTNYPKIPVLILVSNYLLENHNLDISQKKPSQTLLTTILKLQVKHSVLIILNNQNILLIYPASLELWMFYKRVMFLIIVTDNKIELELLEDAEFKMQFLSITIVVIKFLNHQVVSLLLNKRIKVVYQ